MCVKPIQYSCGSVKHVSLRDHEAMFLIHLRSDRDVCDCDRVMDVPRSMDRRCSACERQESTLLNSTEDGSETHGCAEELSGRNLYEAVAGESEDRQDHDNVHPCSDG